MKTYSIDLRQRIVEACEAGTMTQAAVAERFGVSFGFVRKLLTQWRETGELAPRKRGGRRKPTFDDAAVRRLRQAVREHPDATLDELAQLCGVSCCRATVYNTLKREGFRRKKNVARR